MSARTVARLLWVFPTILLALGINQLVVSGNIRSTLDNGVDARARITEIESVNRADVTYGYVSLSVDLGTETFVREKMSMPLSLLEAIAGDSIVDVVVYQGASQEIVIREIGETQWKIAAIQGWMALLGAGMFGAGVWAWNRYLSRSGDPGKASA